MLNLKLKDILLIKTPLILKDQKLICYPYLIAVVKVIMPRPFLKPRIAKTVITADLVKGVVGRSNMVPEVSEVKIKSEALIPSQLQDEEAINKVRKLALKWALSKFHLMKTPDIEIEKVEKAYKAFILTNNENDKTILVDSMKGLNDYIDLTDKLIYK